MKVWHCMVLSGLIAWLPTTQVVAQEPPEAEASGTQTASPPQASSSNSAPQVQHEGASSSREDWTPETLFEHVIEQARTMAGQAYQAPESPLPESLANMGYDDFRDIRFREEAALWRGERLFEVQFFHPGFLYDEPVDLHVLNEGRVDELAFDSNMFHYQNNAASLREDVEQIDAERLGFAGFRLHYPLNSPNYKDEFLVFLGASYFRMVGRGQEYGLSARGLAVNTATQGGEEFPAFRSFWLVPPEPAASRMTLFALLDSPSVTGAYRFDIEATSHTPVTVDARLFARSDVGKLGVAPLTSMFLYGENSVEDYDDFRPEVHDSDGMLLHAADGQWIWRPLSNPPQLNVTQLRDTSPRGFGLMQRDRDFDSYLDMALNYQRRPSLWVEPMQGDWEAGGLELVEIPTDSETYDNIAAYWAPDTQFRAGDVRRYQYRLSTHGEVPLQQDLGQVVRTRQGWGAMPGESNPPPRSLRRFVVDFSGSELANLVASQPVEARLTVSSGEPREIQVKKLPDGRTWRAMFKLAPQDHEPADMQLQLLLRGRPLTETWSYIWNPDVL